MGHQSESVLAGGNGNGGIQLQQDNSSTRLLARGHLAAATEEWFPLLASGNGAKILWYLDLYYHFLPFHYVFVSFSHSLIIVF
jgi:hypothetical protein